MKNIIFIIMLFVTTIMFGQTKSETDTLYCVQIMSTENPHLIKPSDVDFLLDTAYVEYAKVNGRHMYRILYVYSDEMERDVAHYSWLRVYSKSFKCVRTKKQFKNMYPLQFY